MKIINLIKKNKFIILYLIFGVLTTIINIICYISLYYGLKFSNVLSTIIAWIFAVAFAFFTNKIYVFCSKSFKFTIFFYELLTFFSSRIITGILDIIIMWLSVDYFGWNATLWKLASNIIIIILNYIFSKNFIFIHKTE